MSATKQISTGVEISPDVKLSNLAAEINREHAAAEDCASKAVDHARNCGGLLLAAKKAVGHGEWLAWLDANVRVKPRMAQNYMRLACDLPQLGSEDAKRVAFLPIRQALEYISAHACAAAYRLKSFDSDSQQRVLLGVDDGGQTVGEAIREEQSRLTRERYAADADTSVRMISKVLLDTRPAVALYNGKSKNWRLQLGPNCSVPEYEEAVERAKLNVGTDERQAEAQELERVAAELEAQAIERRKAAGGIRSRAADDLRSAMNTDFAHLCPFREHYEFAGLSEEQVASLKACNQEDAAALLLGYLKSERLSRIDIAGNVLWPSTAPGMRMRAEWTGFGFGACHDLSAAEPT
jgi:Protein of unknown function (DUF3102)